MQVSWRETSRKQSNQENNYYYLNSNNELKPAGFHHGKGGFSPSCHASPALAKEKFQHIVAFTFITVWKLISIIIKTFDRTDPQITGACN